MFVFSKLAWALVQPSNLLLLLLLVAALCLLLDWRRLGTWLLCGVTLTLLVVTLLPVGAWLLLPVENRFPPPALPEPAAVPLVVEPAAAADLRLTERPLPLSAPLSALDTRVTEQPVPAPLPAIDTRVTERPVRLPLAAAEESPVVQHFVTEPIALVN